MSAPVPIPAAAKKSAARMADILAAFLRRLAVVAATDQAGLAGRNTGSRSHQQAKVQADPITVKAAAAQ